MPTEKTTQHDDANFSAAQKTLSEFEQHLKKQDGKDVDLATWVEEVPEDHQDEFVPKLLERYWRYRCGKGHTVSVDTLVRQFPRFQKKIHELGGYYQHKAKPDAEETVSTRLLDTKTEYAVHQRPWKSGGQGVLHKAEDGTIGGRQLVVKFLMDTMHEKDFQKEVEVTAKLDHPGVVAVYSQGVDEHASQKRPFFAMRLIDGTPLEERIADFHNRINKANPRERKREFTPSGRIADLIESIISACSTVSHAHSKGVLHCDIKPKNIICGRFRSTIVLDWGSASPCDVPQDQHGDATATIKLPADSIGGLTVAYASPEQFPEEKQRPLTPSSDVYSLGATLYQALTGTAPFDSDRTKDSICPSPREKNSAVPNRLSAICEKAMQHSPVDRYSSVEELADDLTNWLRDEPIVAVPDNWIDRIFRLARRNQKLSLALIALFVVVSVGAATYMTMVVKQRETLENLDLTLQLVEDLTDPLQSDKVQDLREFKDRAEQIDKFAEKYIGRTSSNDSSQPDNPMLLARVYRVKGRIDHYYFNLDMKQASTTPQPKDERERYDRLRNAIGHFEEYLKLLGHSDSESVRMLDAKLALSRWLGQLSNEPEDPDDPDDLEKKMALKLRAVGILHEIDSSLSNEDRKAGRVDVQLKRAEANHRLGDLYHNLGIQFYKYAQSAVSAFGVESAKDCYDKASDYHTVVIKTLDTTDYQKMKPDHPDFQPVSRILARGYGYRGDVLRSQGDHNGAKADYERSLRLREKIAESTENGVESRYQLMWGYYNFAMLVQQFGKEFDDRTTFGDQPRNTGESIEQYVLGTFGKKVEGIRSQLEKMEDRRFTTSLVETKNLMAELHLFAAERDELSASEPNDDLNQMKEILDKVIFEITKMETEAFMRVSAIEWHRIKHRLEKREKADLAMCLMLKLRLNRLRQSDAQNDRILIGRINQLVDLFERDYEELNNDLWLVKAVVGVATAKDDVLDFDPIDEAVDELSIRDPFIYSRLSKHLIGVGMSPEEVEEHLKPLTKAQ